MQTAVTYWVVNVVARKTHPVQNFKQSSQETRMQCKADLRNNWKINTSMQEAAECTEYIYSTLHISAQSNFFFFEGKFNDPIIIG